MDLMEVSVSDHGHFVYYEIADVLKNGREHFISLCTAQGLLIEEATFLTVELQELMNCRTIYKSSRDASASRDQHC